MKTENKIIKLIQLKEALKIAPIITSVKKSACNETIYFLKSEEYNFSAIPDTYNSNLFHVGRTNKDGILGYESYEINLLSVIELSKDELSTIVTYCQNELYYIYNTRSPNYMANESGRQIKPKDEHITIYKSDIEKSVVAALITHNYHEVFTTRLYRLQSGQYTSLLEILYRVRASLKDGRSYDGKVSA